MCHPFYLQWVGDNGYISVFLQRHTSIMIKKGMQE